MDNFKNEKKPKQEKPLLQVFIGIIIVILSIIAISAILNFVPNAVSILISLTIITFSVFLGIKLIRKNYKIAGIIILVISAPVLMLGMAAGACALIFSGGNL